MSTRTGAIVGCALLIGLAACSRRPPAPAPATLAETSSSAEAAQPVELAGGPPADAPAASDAAAADPDQPITPPAPASAPQTSPAASQAAFEPDSGRRSDPLEPVNRRLYALDSTLTRAIHKAPRLAPRSEPHVRAAAKAARNVLANLDEPSVAANDLLQHRFAKALASAVRFVINSTIGVAGVTDIASRLGVHHHDNDADRTLAKYGAPTGPYLYVPIAGPTTLRALIGQTAEGYLYPPHWLRLAAAIGAALKGAGYAKMARGA
ncbi:MAG TPA: MlaA family lipoprotein, partial [Caulobacteraceae bacterium]|nr:MlaA family lipoprotein [Caulobacteraceae bacterium]